MKRLNLEAALRSALRRRLNALATRAREKLPEAAVWPEHADDRQGELRLLLPRQQRRRLKSFLDNLKRG